MTIREIDAQITKLQDLRYAVEKKEILEFKEKAKENVGRCFLINGLTYVKIIDIPKEKHTKTGITFNEYQYPALFLRNGSLPFELGTLFSAAFGVGTNLLGTDYKEISKEEFKIEFEKRIKDFRNGIIGC